MPTVDIEKFLAQSGVRKMRFGGFDEDDVRAAMRTLCAEYDQRLNHVQNEWRRLSQENASLVQQCRTLAGQNRMLSSQNATLAGNGEQYSRQSQELGTEVNRLQERNRSLHDQCAVLRLKNNDLTDENATLKAAAAQAEAALRLRGKELADEIAALRASRQQKLNEAAAEASATLADARSQADALLAEAQTQAEAIEETARRQARAQAQNLVDAAAAEANEIQNAHQLRLNELAAEVRRMEARRERMIQYFNQVGSELLRTGGVAESIDLTPPDMAQPAELPDDFVLTGIPTPQAELDLSPAAVAAVRKAAEAAPPAPETADDAAAQGSTPHLAEPDTSIQDATPAPAPARRAFTLAEEDDSVPAPPNSTAAPASPAPSPASPAVPSAPAAPAPDALADDAAWQDLTLDPAPAQDPLAVPGSLWPDLEPAPAVPPQPDLPPDHKDFWATFGTELPAEPVSPAAPASDAPAAAPWQDVGFDDGPAPAPAGDPWLTTLDPAAAPQSSPDPWAQRLSPAAAPAPSPAPAASSTFDIPLPAAPSAGPELWQDLTPPASAAATPAPDSLAGPTAPAAPAAATAAAQLLPDNAPRQTAPGLTEVPGAIFSSPIVHPASPAAPPAAAPAAAPRAPLLPGQEPDAADDEDTLSGLVAKPADPGAGAAWQRRHKAIRAIQALRRLYR